MKTLIAFGILLAAGFIGSVGLFRKIKIQNPLSYIFYSGTFYILFGLLVGENGFRLISQDIINHLIPVINFSLGWVGFIFGFQLEIKFLKKIPPHWYLALAGTYTFSFVFILGFCLFLFAYIFTGYTPTPLVLWGFSLSLAVLIPESSISFITWSQRFFRKNFQDIRLCAFIASADNFFPILLTGIMFSTFRFYPQTNVLISNPVPRIMLLFCLHLIIGTLAALFLQLLVKMSGERLELSSILLGAVFFISGVSLMFHFSPLFVGMVTGLIFANITKRHSNVIRMINPTEKPVYIIFLIFIALKQAHITIPVLIIAVLMVLAKVHTGIFSFKLLGLVNRKRFDTPPRFSYLLLPLSSIAPAIMLDLLLVYPPQHMSKLLGILIVTMLFSEIIAPLGIRLIQKKINAH